MIKRILIAFSVFLIISFMLVALCINRIMRVDEVFHFRLEVNDRIYEVQTEYISSGYNRDTLAYYDSLAKQIRDVPFDDMVKSFKPLTIENWYNKEQCRFLNMKTKK